MWPVMVSWLLSPGAVLCYRLLGIFWRYNERDQRVGIPGSHLTHTKYSQLCQALGYRDQSVDLSFLCGQDLEQGISYNLYLWGSARWWASQRWGRILFIVFNNPNIKIWFLISSPLTSIVPFQLWPNFHWTGLPIILSTVQMAPGITPHYKRVLFL